LIKIPIEPSPRSLATSTYPNRVFEFAQIRGRSYPARSTIALVRSAHVSGADPLGRSTIVMH
jgi:hypothetical protein